MIVSKYGRIFMNEFFCTLRVTFDLTRSYCPSRQVLRTFLRMNGFFNFCITIRDNTFKTVHPELEEGPRANGFYFMFVLPFETRIK